MVILTGLCSGKTCVFQCLCFSQAYTIKSLLIFVKMQVSFYIYFSVEMLTEALSPHMS